MTPSRRGRLRRDQRGAALVELAVVVPILAVLAVGAVDFGRIFKSAMVITAAARAGALYGAYSVPYAFDSTNITAAVTNVLSSNNMTSGPSPTIAVLCECRPMRGLSPRQRLRTRARRPVRAVTW